MHACITGSEIEDVDASMFVIEENQNAYQKSTKNTKPVIVEKKSHQLIKIRVKH